MPHIARQVGWSAATSGAARVAVAVAQRADVDVVAHLAPAVGAALGEHGVELVLERHDDQDVDRKLGVERASRRRHAGIIVRRGGAIRFPGPDS
jgi:hypothetical protein